jgi:oligopeptide/dipeptide ABC transporter ATP-binding protein
MSLGRSQLRLARQRLQLMFQDPSSAFNPRMNVEQIISEPMLLAGSSKSERRDRVRELLPLVGLAEYQAARFPHQFSGGQRQRIGIARALSLRPDFIVCDEPVSALDVSVQAQVINLLSDLQQQFGLTYLFISHDLRVVRHIADRIGVMYQGRIVELADKNSLYSAPQHPYTRMLLSSVPRAIPNAIKRPILVREKADSTNRLSHQGCNFADRCTQVMTICRTEAPALKTTFGENSVACHLQNATNGGT